MWTDGVLFSASHRGLSFYPKSTNTTTCICTHHKTSVCGANLSFCVHMHSCVALENWFLTSGSKYARVSSPVNIKSDFLFWNNIKVSLLKSFFLVCYSRKGKIIVLLYQFGSILTQFKIKTVIFNSSHYYRQIKGLEWCEKILTTVIFVFKNSPYPSDGISTFWHQQ